MPNTATECVLTLTEAATFLRVSEAALAEKAAAGDVPGRQIGGEWRFLQRALVEWLYAGEPANGVLRPEPGSKEAVRKHFGVWRDDPTAEPMLAEIYKRRGEE